MNDLRERVTEAIRAAEYRMTGMLPAGAYHRVFAAAAIDAIREQLTGDEAVARAIYAFEDNDFSMRAAILAALGDEI
jgi:hypothetical protein